MSTAARSRRLPPPRARQRSLKHLRSGGTDGNEQLTAITGVTLIVLLAVIGVTILRIRQLISVHLFVGLLLMGPVLLKMSSTGYRFARYYLRTGAYRAKGPPPGVMRMIAPVVVISTVTVFVSGILLLLAGPNQRDQYLTIHKASFFVWLAFTAAHVLGHLPGLSHTLRPALPRSELSGAVAGTAGRWIVLAGAIVAGAVVAVVLIPQYAPWTAHGALLHHHRH